MDTLAYNHLVSSYESPRTSDFNGSLVLFRGVNWNKVSGACWMPVLATAIGLSILGASQPANASLYYGDSGYKVKKVQYILKHQDYFYGRATGYYGSKTKHAVKAFQRDNGLYPDGIVGPETAAAMGLGYGGHYPKHDQPTYVPASHGSCDYDCGSGSSYLSHGDRGYAVKQLQNRLAAQGVFYANSTGYYGRLTKQAVAEFQARCGLSVDGIAGPATLAALGL